MLGENLFLYRLSVNWLKVMICYIKKKMVFPSAISKKGCQFLLQYWEQVNALLPDPFSLMKDTRFRV